MADLPVYYFCYGSNMLTARMHVNNKTAVAHSNGVLPGYRLDFSGASHFWKGATANIVPDPNSTVQGVIYRMAESDIANLDRQEIGYNPITVAVTPIGDDESGALSCRSYEQKDDYSARTSDDFPAKQPSKLYKKVILKGAAEHSLPVDYVRDVIEAFPDNGCLNCGPPGLVI